MWLGWVNHVTRNAAGMYPPLEPIVAWAQTNRMRHIATKLHGPSGKLLWLGEVDLAGADLTRRCGGSVNCAGWPAFICYLQAN